MNAPATPDAIVQFVPLADLYPSPTNPRKNFDKKKLEELTDSVKTHGVLQPILVRVGLVANKYEIVAGERRYRAAKAAGRDAIPVMIRDLTDLQVLEIQVVENLQREGLHELEEAEGYERLMKEHKYTADDIAAKVNKSRAYVYGRLKLCALATPEPRASFANGKFSASIALLIARIPVADLQRQAAKEILDDRHRGPLSYRDAADHLQRNYMLRLDQASFDTGAAALLPAAGACGPCPKRTGNQKDLFPDVKSADICTDPKCFAAKKAAHMEKLRKEAEARGQTVITGKEAKALMPYQYTRPSGYVGANDWCHAANPSKEYGKLLGKNAPLPTLLENPHTGELMEVWLKSEVDKILRDKKIIKPAPKAQKHSSLRPVKPSPETELRTLLYQRLFLAVRAKFTALTSVELANLAENEMDCGDADRDVFAKLWGWNEKQLANSDKTFAAMNAQDLHQALFDLLMLGEISYSSTKPEKLLAAAARYKVDADKIKAEVKAELKAKAEAEKNSAKKAKAA